MHELYGDLERILFHETTILARLDELSNEIVRDYAGKDLTVVAVMHGSIIFMADLLRRIPIPLQIDAVRVSSYGKSMVSSGKVDFLEKDLPRVAGRHVLLLDDILDSGRTLAAIRQRILEEANPASIKICVLLNKDVKRAADVHVDYVGFDIGDEFVVGYGLDYAEQYRNLPCIGVLSPSAVK
jgi:hypoxanthine phosphoribosyltransferase